MTSSSDPFDSDSVLIELDWDICDPIMDNAVDELFDLLAVGGHTKNVKRHIRAVLSSTVHHLRKYGEEIPYIRYSRNNNAGTKSDNSSNDQRNPDRLSCRKIGEIIDAFLDKGFIEHHMGFNASGERRQKQSRFKPNYDMKAFIDRHGLLGKRPRQIPINGGMILKDDKKKIIYDYKKYDKDKDIQRSKDILSDYNELIANTDIALTRSSSGSIIDFDHIQTWRIFNNGSFKEGGRFYNGWWASCPSSDRKHISIDGKPTVECDYKANHLYILYGLKGMDMPAHLVADPYDVGSGLDRAVVKVVCNRIISCAGLNGAWQSVQKSKKENSDESPEDREFIRKNIPDKATFDKIRDAVLKAHPILDKYKKDKMALILQNWDARIAEYVIKELTDAGIPVLCVHDSFIVAVEHEESLLDKMKDAYTALKIPKGLPSIKKEYSY